MGKHYLILINYKSRGYFLRSPRSTNERRRLTGAMTADKEAGYKCSSRDHKRMCILKGEANAWYDKSIGAYSPWMENIYKNRLKKRIIRRFRKRYKKITVEVDTED